MCHSSQPPDSKNPFSPNSCSQNDFFLVNWVIYIFFSSTYFLIKILLFDVDIFSLCFYSHPIAFKIRFLEIATKSNAIAMIVLVRRGIWTDLVVAKWSLICPFSLLTKVSIWHRHTDARTSRVKYSTVQKSGWVKLCSVVQLRPVQCSVALAVKLFCGQGR